MGLVMALFSIATACTVGPIVMMILLLVGLLCLIPRETRGFGVGVMVPLVLGWFSIAVICGMISPYH